MSNQSVVNDDLVLAFVRWKKCEQLAGQVVESGELPIAWPQVMQCMEYFEAELRYSRLGFLGRATPVIGAGDECDRFRRAAALVLAAVRIMKRLEAVAG